MPVRATIRISTEDPNHKAIVARQLAMGARVLAERRDFTLLEVESTPTGRDAVAMRSAGVAFAEEMAVPLVRRTITPGRERSAVQASAKSGMKIVQFHAPLTEEERAQYTAETGASIVHGLGGGAYLVSHPDKRAARALRSAQCDRRLMVRYSEDVQPADVIHPVLDAARASREIVPITLVLHDDGSGAAETDLRWLQGQRGVAIVGTPSRGILPRTTALTVQVPGRLIDRLAARPTVTSITAVGSIVGAGESSSLILAGQLKEQAGNLVPLQPVADGADYLTWLLSNVRYAGFQEMDPSSWPVLGIIDSGIDNGLPSSPVSADFYVGGWPGGLSRISGAFEWDFDNGAPLFPPNVKGGTNHGQAVASIAGGFNNQSRTNPSFADPPTGYLYGSGVNPLGRLYNVLWGNFLGADVGQGSPTLQLYQQIADMVRTLNDEVEQINDRDGGNQTLVTNNSWMVNYNAPCHSPPDDPTESIYDINSQVIDAATRDARLTFTGPPEAFDDILFSFAAGNSGWVYADFNIYECCDGIINQTQCRPVPRMNTIYNPGLCKNVISVGACEAVDALPHPWYCFTPNTCCTDNVANDPSLADSANDIAYYSSKGTAVAGQRIKPDIVAPGMHTYANGIEEEYCRDGSINPDVVVNEAPYPVYLRTQMGTSFSTPHISAMTQIAAVILQQEDGVTSPTPALLKAFTLGTAAFMTGTMTGPYGPDGNQLYTESLPSSYQGFGRADLGAAFDDAPRYIVNQSITFDSINDVWSISGTVADPTKPFRAVLTWTDCYGSSLAYKWSNLVNDLDLYVMVSGAGGDTHYVGNDFNGGTSTPAATALPYLSAQRPFADTANNVEAVFLGPNEIEVANSVLVRIKPWVLAGDAIAMDPTAPGRQDFALVLYNFVPEQ